MEFSVPYNNDPETLSDILKLKEQNGNRIREIYLSGPQEYSGSGRIAPGLSFDGFAAVVEQIHLQGIRVNLLLNSTCEGLDWYSPAVLRTTMDYLERVHRDLGVESLTISNPLYIREVRKRFPDIEICASVLADIDCVQTAVIYTKAGANVITPDVNINRNPALLKKIREATGTELKLMVNEGCLQRCPFRKFHFNYISHKSRNPGTGGKTRPEDNVFSANCLQLTKSDPSQVLKSCWIRPEDLEKYRGVTEYFKIVGRTSSRSMVIRSVEAYMNQNWTGDLMELMAGNLYSFAMSGLVHLDNKALDTIPFFERVTSCSQECYDCTFCSEVASALLRRGVFTTAKIEDLGIKGANTTGDVHREGSKDAKNR